MKSSFGLLLRQGCSARSIATRLHHSSHAISNSYLCSSIEHHRFQPVTAASFPFSSRSLHSEHALNSTSTSSSNSDSRPPPLPLSKKRSNAARQGIPAQTRKAAKEPNKGSSLVLNETKRRQPEESLMKSKASTNSAKATQASATTSSTGISMQPGGGGKAPEPQKTIMQRIKGLWENIKYLFRFYYQGTKQIWKDRQIVAELRKKITQREAQSGEGVRWIENAIIKQHEADLRKLPLFLAILLILEEILPLVVIYAPSLLPSTCVLPSQSTKMRSGEERVRGLAIFDLAKDEQIRSVVEQIVTKSETNAKTEIDVQNVQPLATYGAEVVRQMARVYALSAFGPISMISSRIDKYLNKLQSDDQLLRRALQTKSTSSQWKEITQSDWLWKACAQRGLRAFEAEDQIMERNLIAYLHLSARNLNSTDRSLLPLALYDLTPEDLKRLEGEAKEEHSKGIRRRTQEVVQEVKEAEKKKEENH